MQKITFTGALGHNLAARLDVPAGEVKAYALFAHCFTCTKDIHAATNIARALNDAGIAVLRFDFTGLGASEGEFANTNFTSNVQDLVAAANFMRDELRAPAILIGHSLGGAAVIAAASQIPEARAVATIGAPASAAHVAHHFSGSRDEIMQKGEAEVQLVGRPFKIRRQFVEDIEATNMDRNIAGLKRALLVCHAPLDQTVGIDNATHIFKTAKHPKSFLSLDDADHLLTRREHASYAAHVIAAWAARYAGYEAAIPPMTAPSLPAHHALVRSRPGGKFAHDVFIGGGHRLTADEPQAMGGDDKGPNPYDFLLAALGTCKAMTMRIYADHKGFPLEGVDVRLSHEKIEAVGNENSQTHGGKIDKFTVAIDVKGDALTAEQKQKIHDIAQKCPVHRTLQSDVIIETAHGGDDAAAAA